jgi:hypothetical protein
MLTDPSAEAATEKMSTDDSSESDQEPDDSALDELQALEAAINENSGNYDAHLQVSFMSCPPASALFA